jgi:cell division protein YceG involved in septum cleavage
LKKLTVIIAIVLILALAAGGTLYYMYQNRYTTSPQKAVEGLVSIYYFDQGTYEEYTKLFANKTIMQTKEGFDDFRKTKTAKDVFTSDYESIESVMSHMKVKQIDENNAEIYWLPNAATDDFTKAESYWVTTKINGKWYLN